MQNSECIIYLSVLFPLEVEIEEQRLIASRQVSSVMAILRQKVTAVALTVFDMKLCLHSH